MILYDFTCADGHRFEAGLASMHSPDPACPVCRRPSSRRPSAVTMAGQANPGPSRDEMPRSWQGVRGGDRSTLDGWRKLAVQREKLEHKYPELAGDRRPVLAHEGIFASNPLRVGDDIPSRVTDAIAETKTTEQAEIPSKDTK